MIPTNEDYTVTGAFCLFLKINPKNNRYHLKKKRRKRYYRIHLGKRIKLEKKALISKEEYYKKIEKSAKKIPPKFMIFFI